MWLNAVIHVHAVTQEQHKQPPVMELVVYVPQPLWTLQDLLLSSGSAHFLASASAPVAVTSDS